MSSEEVVGVLRVNVAWMLYAGQEIGIGTYMPEHEAARCEVNRIHEAFMAGYAAGFYAAQRDCSNVGVGEGLN